MKKKGVELAMNTIIIAAIALIVLVVVVLIFTGGFGDVSGKFKRILGGVGNQADCVIIGNDPTNDKDDDGYHDSQTYVIKYTQDGNKQEVTCRCDIDGGSNPSTNKDTSSAEHSKYC